MVKTISINSHRLKKFRDDNVLKTVELLSKEIGNSAYLVGGALRNMFISKMPQRKVDWDFAISHKALQLGEKVANKLGAFYFVLDRTNRTGRVIYHAAEKEYELDFTDYKGRDLKEDLRRRDFTINTLCLDLKCLMSGTKDKIIVDNFKALEDIKNKCIRLTHERNFSDDPLRILRGFTFCAQFGFNFERRTLELARRGAYRLRKTSPERICEELAKIFYCKNSYKYILKMDELGILNIIFPEISSLQGVDQGAFHHLDVWKHSLKTLHELEKIIKDLAKNFSKKQNQRIQEYLNEEIAAKKTRLWLLKLACVLHDVGKPATKFLNSDGKVHFYAHEKKGAQISQAIGRRLKLSGKEISVIKNTVMYHLRPGQLVNRVPSKRAKFRFLRDARDNAALILFLALADRRAMQGVLSRKKSFVFLEDEIFKMIKTFFNSKDRIKKKKTLLDGNAVMKLLQISPGPVVGMILKTLEEAQFLAKISNKKEAENLAQEVFDKIKSTKNELPGKIRYA